MTIPLDATKQGGSRGIPIVISAPSGAGKSTIASKIAQQNRSTALSISCTTRLPRPGEAEGIHYFFISEQDFQHKIEQGQFLEWAVVHGHYYGTPLLPLESLLNNSLDVLLTIDPQGAISVKRHYPDAVFIFVVPPSWDVLLKRLYKRATDDTDSMELRIANAREELSHLSHYDYLVINDALDTAVHDVSAIITAERCRLSRIDKKQIPIFSKES